MPLSAVAYSLPSLSIQAIDLADQFNVPCVDLSSLCSSKQKDIDNYLSEQLAMDQPVVLLLGKKIINYRFFSYSSLFITGDGLGRLELLINSPHLSC